MNIRAVVFDLDGTAIPVEVGGIPSSKVISAVSKSKTLVKVSAATGRPFYSCERILKALNINEPCIISGGSQIVDPATGAVLWEKYMDAKKVAQVMAVIKDYSYKIYTSDNPILLSPSEIEGLQSERVIYVMYVDREETEDMVERLRAIDGIDAHAMASWEKGKLDVHITHKDATKRNAMKELLRMLDVKREQVMVVGDGGNDLPLFEESGFRVAMGNAGEALKSKADHITGNVENDGLAMALEKYVIRNGKI